MLDREKLIQEVERGQNIVAQLFKLSDVDLKDKIQKILGGQNNEIFNYDPSVRRVILDEKPSEITIYFWDTLTIMWYGIDYTPEHGDTIRVKEFDGFFTL